MFWENFIKLCNQHNIKPNALGKKLNFSSGSITNWKKGQKPHDTSLQKIAEYFGVTIDQLLGNEQSREPSNISSFQQQSMRAIPVYETVSAGFGSQAEDCIVDYLPCFIPSENEAENSIAIKVKGDSMYPKIEDGDIIRIVKQSTVENGQIAVVLVDNEGYVKRINIKKDGIELESINPNYPPMRFNGNDTERIRIVGLVKQVIKNIN